LSLRGKMSSGRASIVDSALPKNANFGDPSGFIGKIAQNLMWGISAARYQIHE